MSWARGWVIPAHADLNHPSIAQFDAQIRPIPAGPRHTNPSTPGERLRAQCPRRPPVRPPVTAEAPAAVRSCMLHRNGTAQHIGSHILPMFLVPQSCSASHARSGASGTGSLLLCCTSLPRTCRSGAVRMDASVPRAASECHRRHRGRYFLLTGGVRARHDSRVGR